MPAEPPTGRIISIISPFWKGRVEVAEWLCA